MSEDWSGGWEIHRGLDSVRLVGFWVGRIDWGPGESAGHGSGAALWRRLVMWIRGAGARVRQGAMAGARLSDRQGGRLGTLFGRGIMDESNEHSWRRFGRRTF